MAVAIRGETFDPALDGERLGAQLRRVRDLVRDGAWRTLGEIAAVTGDPEASISARLRDLRRAECGAWVVERRRRGGPERGLWEYRALPAVVREPVQLALGL